MARDHRLKTTALDYRKDKVPNAMVYAR